MLTTATTPTILCLYDRQVKQTFLTRTNEFMAWQMNNRAGLESIDQIPKNNLKNLSVHLHISHTNPELFYS